jgi:hypothetical protein
MMVWIYEVKDELNTILPYTEEGINEVLNLMLITHHMASIASSSMIVGYHQDVNLAAYLLSLEGTYVEEDTFEELAAIVWEQGSQGKIISIPQEEWRRNLHERCLSVGVEPYSGRALFSSLLPTEMNWSRDDALIKDGILIRGVMNEKICSATPSSIGMNILRTLGSQYAMSWLNSSYQMLGRYVQLRGTTLGFPDIQINADKQKEIDAIIENGMKSAPPILQTGDITIDARRETDIMTHLGNIRDTVGVAILGDKDPKNVEVVHMSMIINRTVLRMMEIPLRAPFSIGDDDEEVEVNEGSVTISTQQGYIKYSVGGEDYTWSMGLFPEVTLNGTTWIHRVHPLKAMIESGARGNSVSATQVAGSIGSLTYEGGRIPLMMQAGAIPRDTDKPTKGRRSMPIYPFGTDTPKAKGYIGPSYLKGVGAGDYVASHVASRQNMSANTSLTPMTGYFGRSMRVFTENLQIDYVEGKQAVVNERGVLVSLDHVLDPSKIFAIDGQYTFVNVGFELNNLRKKERTTSALYVQLPYKTDYLSYDTWLHTLKKVEIDIIISVDPRTDQEYYTFLRDILPKEIERKVTVLRSRNYMAFSEYESILVVPPEYPITDSLLSKKIPTGVSALMGITMRKVPTIRDLFPLIVGLIDISSVPMLARPAKEYKTLLQTHSLIEAILLMGDILPLD